MFLVLIGFALSTAVTSCKDDDKEPSSDGLAGTTWKITSDTGDEVSIGMKVTFKSDGNINFSPANDWTYAKWSMTGNKLKMVLGEGEPDDYMEGTFVINGNNATYTYSWYDYDGEWGGEDTYVMTLTKQ